MAQWIQWQSKFKNQQGRTVLTKDIVQDISNSFETWFPSQERAYKIPRGRAELSILPGQQEVGSVQW